MDGRRFYAARQQLMPVSVAVALLLVICFIFMLVARTLAWRGVRAPSVLTLLRDVVSACVSHRTDFAGWRANETCCYMHASQTCVRLVINMVLVGMSCSCVCISVAARLASVSYVLQLGPRRAACSDVVQNS